MRLLSVALAVLAAIGQSGCSDQPRGRVHGAVTVNGKPLARATIIFIAGDKKTHLAALKPDGSYDVSGVALGQVKVSIQADLPKVAPRPEPGKSGAGGASKGLVVDEKAARQPLRAAEAAQTQPVSPIYADPDKSGLTFELTNSDQEWSVDLK